MNATKNQICETQTQKEESSKTPSEVRKMEKPNPDKSTEETKETKQRNNTGLLSTIDGLRPAHQPKFTEYRCNFRPDTIPNLLLQMKAGNKSYYTINFTRKALTLISKHESLNEPQTIKMFIKKRKRKTVLGFALFEAMLWN